jgi:hypothetical protein
LSKGGDQSSGAISNVNAELKKLFAASKGLKSLSPNFNS